MRRYEVRRADTGEVLSKHRTKGGAMLGGRSERDLEVEVWRTYSDTFAVLIARGAWHLPTPPPPVTITG
jgi:hypothetical protein